MPKDLRSFLLQVMEAQPGTIKHVSESVDRNFGISAMVSRFEANGDFPVLYFENVQEADVPCITNVAASYDRLALALDASVDTMSQVYGERLKNPVPPVEVDRSQAPVKEVIWQGSDADLTRLPIPLHQERDGGAYLTSGVGITRDPETGALNCGMYRSQVHGPQELGIWFRHSNHGAYLHRAYEAMNKPMPIAIAIGHHPGLLMGAVTRLPGIGGEYGYAGALMGEPVELVKAETSDLLVPARAEIVIEGEVLAHERREEGPFGEWTKMYMMVGPEPVVRVKCITMRQHAMYHDVATASNEQIQLGALPRMGSVYRNAKQVVPGVRAVNVPAASRMFCFISLKKTGDSEIKKAAFAALNTEPENLRIIVVVDDDINVFNEGEVLWALGARFNPVEDLLVIPNWSGPGGTQPTGWQFHADGRKLPQMVNAMIMDATKPAPPIDYPTKAEVPSAAIQKAKAVGVQEFQGCPALTANPTPAR